MQMGESAGGLCSRVTFCLDMMAAARGNGLQLSCSGVAVTAEDRRRFALTLAHSK